MLVQPVQTQARLTIILPRSEMVVEVEVENPEIKEGILPEIKL